MFEPASVIVLMGVSGSGKSTIGQALATTNGWPFIEGDDYHPAENIEKQMNGVPLNNSDRVAWIKSMAKAVNASPNDSHIVLACSALNAFVRNALLESITRNIIWVWLDVQTDELRTRLSSRQNHFMPAELLDSQLTAFTPPAQALQIDGAMPPDQIVNDINSYLNGILQS